MIWLATAALGLFVGVGAFIIYRRWQAEVEVARVQREQYRKWQAGLERLQREAYVKTGRKLPESLTAWNAASWPTSRSRPEQRGLPIVEAMRAAWREHRWQPGGRIRGRR